MANIPKAFEIILQHFSDQTLCQNQEEIYDRIDALDLDKSSDPVKPGCVKRTLRYLKDFGLVENPEHRCWCIKSVDDMCNRLCDLDDDPYIRVRESKHPISLAFGIIVHHFNDRQTVPTTEIETRIETEIENYQGELSKYKKENVVPHTLRFLNHFDFAKELEDGDWHIKSVDDMCKRLRGLDDNRNSGGC